MENCYFNHIAKDYHLKRKKPWKPFESFLTYLKKKNYGFKGLTVDLGCGNGRHFNLLQKISYKLIGIDNSIELLKIALEDLKHGSQYSKNDLKIIQIILADQRFIPLRQNEIHNIFAIASIHHIRHKVDRQHTIEQLFDLLKYEGYILITVWRKWQKKYKSYFFYDWFWRIISSRYEKAQKMEGLEECGDKYVSWKISSKKERYNRFYHFFSKHEIKKLIKIFKIQEFKTMGGPNNRDNFFILAQKL